MQVICAVSCRALPLLPTTYHKNLTITYILIILDDFVFIIWPYIYKYINGTSLQYHGPHTMVSLKQVAKTIDPLHYHMILQKGGDSNHSDSLISCGIFQLLHCAVHFVLRCTLRPTKSRVFTKNYAKLVFAQQRYLYYWIKVLTNEAIINKDSTIKGSKGSPSLWDQGSLSTSRKQ